MGFCRNKQKYILIYIFTYGYSTVNSATITLAFSSLAVIFTSSHIDVNYENTYSKLNGKKLGNKIFTARLYIIERDFVITIPVSILSAKLKIYGVIHDKINLLITYTLLFLGKQYWFFISWLNYFYLILSF